MTLLSSFLPPPYSNGSILRDSLTCNITETEIWLRISITLFSSFCKPVNRLFYVFFYTLSGENGAYPPTKSGSIHPLLSWKSAWNWPKKRSISVQYRLKRWKSLKKTEHCRSPVVREVWWIPKSYRKRSIAVHIGKNESLLSNDLRPKNGALPFTFSIKRQYASGKRSIAVHYSALSCVICM